MPVIPGVQESQVLNPSSPVPIGSTGDARLPGETIERFGAAMVALGDALDVAGRSAKNEKAKLDVLNAENKYRMALLQRRAQQDAAAPIPEDVNGFGAVQAVANDMDPIAQEIASGLEPEAQAKFLARAGDILNDNSVTIWADEVKKRASINKVAVDNIVAQSGQLARMSDDIKDTGFMMDHVETAIMDNNDLAPSQKPIDVAAAKKSVVMDSIQGRISRNNFAEAEIVLEAYGGNLFTPAEKNKQLDEIRSAEGSYYTRELNKLTRDEKQINKAKAASEDKYLAYFSTALQQAGNSDIKREPILRDIELMKIAGKIDVTKADSLIGNKVFKDLADDKKDVEITTRAFKTGNFQEAIDTITKIKGVSLSYDRAQQMVGKFEQWKERGKNDPIARQRIQTGEDLIRAQGAESMTDMMNSLAKRQLQTKINTAVQQYYRTLQGNPQADPDVVSRSILDKQFGVSTASVRGNSDIYAETSLQGLTKMAEKTVRDGQALKKSGLLTPAKNKEILQKLQDIKKKQLELQIKNPQYNNGSNSNQETSKTSGGARGK